MRQNGVAIRVIRTLLGLSLRQLAHAADLTHGYVSRLETEQRDASPEALDRIAEAMGVPVAAVLRESPRDHEGHASGA